MRCRQRHPCRPIFLMESSFWFIQPLATPGACAGRPPGWLCSNWWPVCYRRCPRCTPAIRFLYWDLSPVYWRGCPFAWYDSTWTSSLIEVGRHTILCRRCSSPHHYWPGSGCPLPHLRPVQSDRWKSIVVRMMLLNGAIGTNRMHRHIATEGRSWYHRYTGHMDIRDEHAIAEKSSLRNS